MTQNEKIVRLERIVVELYEIAKIQWGGEGTWQDCWDEVHLLVKELKDEAAHDHP